MGNPTSWKSMKMSWSKGRELSTVTNGSAHSYKYYYNSDGRRVKKDVDGTVTQYYLNGDTIVAMKSGNDMIHFTYDPEGNLFSMRLNGVNYYYIHNIQNDVIGLVDSAGTMVVSYQYDSWGQLLSMTDSTTTKAGTKNPFRYREYCWDAETSLYYLDTRYYDPEVGRFLNADDVDVLKVNQNSLFEDNLYVYCLNNPVNKEDKKGEFAWALAGGGALASGTGLGALGSAVGSVVGILSGPVGIAILGAVAIGALAYAGIKYSKAKSRYKKEKKTKNKVKSKSKTKERVSRPIARRKRYNSRKKAKQAALRAGRGKIRNDYSRRKGHYHPQVNAKYRRTPKGISSHDHYYYPR